MPKFESIIRTLEEGNVRRIDGAFVDETTNQEYQYRAYTISNPQNLIRIDIRRIK